jgi:hypothetical protein
MSKATITTRCVWCGRILRQDGWHPERRLRRTLYARSVCPGCVAQEGRSLEAEDRRMEGEYFYATRKAIAEQILRRWRN